MTGEYLPDNVGRCDREHGCGYEFTWAEYYRTEGKVQPLIVQFKPEEVKPVDYLDKSYLEPVISDKFYNRNNFFLFLQSRYSEQVAKSVFLQYLIGTSGYWKGATLFPQFDNKGNLRQIKVILYNPETGKRIKEGAQVQRYDRTSKQYIKETTNQPCSMIYGRFINEHTKCLNLEQTFFGCHLLAEYRNNEVCIVESEKTAAIASIHLPQFVWLATGGASGCKWREYNTYKVLANRSVTFFPDYGTYNKKTGKTCFEEWRERIERIKETIHCKIRVSAVLENHFVNQERKDQDLADLFLENIDSTGLVLNEFNYPVMWDYQL